MKGFDEKVTSTLQFYAETWDEFMWSYENEANPDEVLATPEYTSELSDTLSRLEEEFKRFGDYLNGENML